MIYPKIFPEDRKNEIAELVLFENLKKLETKYDIFYSKRFVNKAIGKKPEFEIDFIVSIPERAVLCLEVKGGMIDYNGEEDNWLQNGKKMKKNPIGQASANSHSLANLFSESISNMPVGWGLCFPDCEVQNINHLPPSVDSNQIVDKLGVLYLEDSLKNAFEFLINQNPSRTGVKKWQYDKFKKTILRNIGFSQTLGTQIKYDEQRFIELTKNQLDLFNRVALNKSIIISGPAGSGKTILAKTVAQDFMDNGLNVLFLCFNRTLANKIRYDFDKRAANIEVTTFHSLARKIITEFDEAWWVQQDKNEDGFWDLAVPIKLEEVIEFYKEKYDAIIIDEGQDFKEFWFEMVFKLLKADGYRLVFLDELQNIFNHFENIPGDSFFRYQLLENCRNTKNIVKYLSKVIGNPIKSFPNSPKGAEVVEKELNGKSEVQLFLRKEIQRLLNEEKIDQNQILILLNSPKKESSIADLEVIGNRPLKPLDNKGRFQNNAINYTTINTFKGLEADVVFIIDIDKIKEENKTKLLYTEASRAKHKIYFY